MSTSTVLDKIISFGKKEIRKESVVGMAIALLYRLLSSAIFQCMINAFFAFYASAYAVIGKKLNWTGIAIYALILVIIGVINQYRHKQYKRVDLLKNVLEQYVTVVDLADDDLINLLGKRNSVNVLDDSSQAIVLSVYEALQAYYNERKFKISIVQNFKDKNGAYCKMTAYNKLSAIPERRRTKYYHSDIVAGNPQNFPFFSRVLAETENEQKYIGSQGEIYIRSREEIQSLFEDSQNRNGTQQYLGVLVYNEAERPIMLLQVCANFEDGFGDIEDVNLVLNTILIPYGKQLSLAYDIQRFLEQESV